MSTYEPCAQTNWPPQPEAPSQARESQLHLATSHSNRRLEELKWSVLDNLSRLIDQGIHGPSPRRTQLNLNRTSRSVCEQLEKPVRGFLSIPTTRRSQNAVVAKPNEQKTKITIRRWQLCPSGYLKSCHLTKGLHSGPHAPSKEGEGRAGKNYFRMAEVWPPLRVDNLYWWSSVRGGTGMLTWHHSWPYKDSVMCQWVACWENWMYASINMTHFIAQLTLWVEGISST